MTANHIDLEALASLLGLPWPATRRLVGDLAGEPASIVTRDSLLPVDAVAARLRIPSEVLHAAIDGSDPLIDVEQFAAIMRRTSQTIWLRVKESRLYWPAVHVPHMLTRWRRSQAIALLAAQDRYEASLVQGVAVPTPENSSPVGPQRQPTPARATAGAAKVYKLPPGAQAAGWDRDGGRK